MISRNVAGSVVIAECPICYSRAIGPLWALPLSRVQPAVVVSGAQTELWPILDREAKIYCYDACSDCGSIFRNPADGGSKEAYRTTKRYDGLLDDAARLRGHRAQYDRWIRPYLPVGATAPSLLDVCCGAGEYLSFALEEFPRSHLVGVELAERPMAELERRYHGRIKGLVQDADVPGCLSALQPEGSFDFAIWAESFEHVDNPPLVLRNTAAMLKRGTGRMFLTAQATDGRLPIRPEEPIYTSERALRSVIAAAALNVDVLTLEAGRWKAIVTRM